MPVVFLIAAIAVLGGVFFAATGRGGEMAPEQPDHVPLDLGPVSAPDIALLRPPTALWGYNMQVTDEALDHIARAMRDRDVTIAHLQQQLAGHAGQDPSAPPASLAPPAPATSQTLQPFLASQPSLASSNADAHQASRISRAPGVPLARHATPPSELTQLDELPQLDELTQPAAEATQPVAATQVADVTRPAASQDVVGPQGPYNAHGWWAQQDAAEREEAARQAQAKADGPAAAGEPAPPEAAGYLATPPAHREDSDPGRTITPPNPTVTPPPDDDPLAVAEEHGR